MSSLPPRAGRSATLLLGLVGLGLLASACDDAADVLPGSDGGLLPGLMDGGSRGDAVDGASAGADGPVGQHAPGPDAVEPDASFDDALGPVDPGSPDSGTSDLFTPDDATVAGNDAAGEMTPDTMPDAGPAGDAVAPQDPGPVERTYRVWHWNVAGAKIHGGDTNDGLIQVMADSIIARDAHFVSLNELCHTQYTALMRKLQARNWPDDPDRFARFVASIPAGNGRCHGESYGNAVFSRLRLGAGERFVLPDDGTFEHRAMICAPVAALPHLRFCSVHITIHPGANVRQLQAVLQQLETYHDGGDTVILAGDLNATPGDDRMKRFYSSSVSTLHNHGNTGHYHELDDADAASCPGHGERTTPRTTGGACNQGPKIDYLFVRQDRIADDYSADSLDIPTSCGGPCSDHRILTGQARLRVRR